MAGYDPRRPRPAPNPAGEPAPAPVDALLDRTGTPAASPVPEPAAVPLPVPPPDEGVPRALVAGAGVAVTAALVWLWRVWRSRRADAD